MNLGVSAVAGKTIVSFSDAHSLPNMGRKLTVFEGKPGYYDLADGLKKNKVVQTVEFFLKPANIILPATVSVE